MNYTPREMADIVEVYYRSGANRAATIRNYTERYLERRHPDGNVIARLIQRFKDTGSCLISNEGGRPRTTRTPRMEEEILQIFKEHPEKSTRSVGRQLGVDHMSVYRVLKEDSQHPYKICRVQELRPTGYAKRTTFCQWLLERESQEPGFSRRILFSDESKFDHEGVFNNRNNHCWNRVNPYATQPRAFQKKWSINLWGGIVGTYVIGPVVIPDRLTGEIYTQFLRTELPEILEEVPLEIRRGMWFQQDGAAPHYHRVAIAALDDIFPHRWIGRRGPVEWPPRSPDLNPLDFFLWGYLKNSVYTGIVDDPDDLAARLDIAFADISEEMLDSMHSNLLRRARLCIQVNGQHFQHLLKLFTADIYLKAWPAFLNKLAMESSNFFWIAKQGYIPADRQSF
ncbi:histone-lysine N-methyltransferase SETMAR-like [Prorops nasuta]|uniref:histone-lysine N-methyltransferase SETMAR-like n=1 Tax=Prorops nasuta TaxID=863751 RepID=UPI0034CF5613